MPKSKYRREQFAKEDKQQATLNPKAEDFIQVKPQNKLEITVMHTGTYYCPFCLHNDRINAYLISGKKGYDKRLGQCPECGHKMMFATLTKKMSAEEFADFAYGYASDGYWQKVKFSVFNYRLNKMGIAKKFWQRYKELKGDDDQEKYADYVQRVQEEEAREKGLIE